jgi:diacylglycerol kinase (ATP)
MGTSRVCVIFNPSAGRRRAARRLKAFRERWRHAADFRPTESAGHARTLAARAADEGYQIVAAAGGDGTVHEVAGGILQAGAEDVTFAVVPLGSANDYAFSIEQQFGRAQLDDDTGHLVDVGVVRTERGEHSFVEGVGIGLTAQITVESRKITHRQGLWLYGTAAFRVLCRRERAAPLRLTWDEEPPVEAPTRLLSVLLGQREGNFLMARQALLDDGQFDIVHGGDVGPWQALALLPKFLAGGPPADHPQITLRRCRTLHVESPDPLTLHADGEVLATPGDNVHTLDIDLLPKRLRVKVCRL